MLTAEGLVITRGDRVLLRGFDLCVNPGERVHLKGPNGVGKSTLIKVLCGLRRAEEGRVCWHGTDIRHDPDSYERSLLYIGHENALNPDLSAVENLHSLQAILGCETEGVERALQDAGLKGRMHLPCRKLSAGQRRRAALSRLLSSRHPLWILDEPAAALDAAGRAWLEAMMLAHGEAGGAVLFSAHEPLAEAGCRVVELT